MHRFSILLALATFVLIIAGGLVTSTGSGLAVPDWPLSYGQVFPPMIGGIRFEHTHRVIAGTVGVLTLFFMLGLLRTERRRWVKQLGVAAFLAVVLQAVLGGLTVIYLLPKAVSVSHACLAQSFFSLIAALALVTSKEWLYEKRRTTKNAKPVQRLSLMIAVFAFCQLAAGAVVRHAHGRGVIVHILLALLILLHILLVGLKISKEELSNEKLFSHALFLGAFVITQIGLGFGTYISKYLLPPAEAPRLDTVLLATAHQSLGALILAAAVLLALRSHRLLISAC